MKNKEKKILRRFLKYARIDSRSDVKLGEKLGKGQGPSTPGQTEIIKAILSEISPYVVQGRLFISLLGDGSLLLYFPGRRLGYTVCLASHVDTYYGFEGGAKPILNFYGGGNIKLPKNGKVIPAEDLAGKEGKIIITADGSTTLGADDKAGVAVLVQIALDILWGEITDYGPLYLWFCTDEEIGKLDTEVVPPEIVKSWDILITVDGGNPKDIVTECFSMTDINVEFFGRDAHAGDNGNKIRPANYAICQLVTDIMYKHKTPWGSKDREGFIYASQFGVMTPEYAEVYFCPRSFDLVELNAFYDSIVKTIKKVVAYYGVTYKISENKLTCVNTKNAIDKKMNLLEPIIKALAKAGCDDPRFCAGRYGTDGAMVNLNIPDLPAPDIGTGGYNVHGPLEYLVVEEMYTMYKAIRALLPLYAYSSYYGVK